MEPRYVELTFLEVHARYLELLFRNSGVTLNKHLFGEAGHNIKNYYEVISLGLGRVRTGRILSSLVFARHHKYLKLASSICNQNIYSTTLPWQ